MGLGGLINTYLKLLYKIIIISKQILKLYSPEAILKIAYPSFICRKDTVSDLIIFLPFSLTSFSARCRDPYCCGTADWYS